jgi:hypothetical protein
MGVKVSMQIDNYWVEFEPQEGWHCQCGEFERSNTCEHTVLSACLHKFEETFAQSETREDIQRLLFMRYGYRS